MLHARGVGPSGCFAACFFVAFGLSAYNGLLIRVLRLPAIIVTLAPFTNGRAIQLGVANDPIGSGFLNLTDAELDTITAGIIGSKRR